MSFAVYGYPVSEVEQNPSGATIAEQQTTPPERVIYVADEESEAVHIVNAGGYIDSDNVWQVATRYVETAAGEVLDPGVRTTLRKPAAAAPLRDAVPPPDNSSADVDPATGRVRSDATKKPLKFAQGDVEAMAQADLEIPKKRTVIHTEGNLERPDNSLRKP